MKQQGPKNILLEFFDSNEIRELPAREHDGNKEETENDSHASLFLRPEEGCNNASDSIGELELHIYIGVNKTPNRKKESLYDTIRRNWAERFFSHRLLLHTITTNQPGDILVSSE